ncbi:hypothetical protein ABZT51_38520 [Streptomyces sp. NPDC005373]|uniref:hypothetical protein n=1 Tax=unclassified Streptomyces TaxID=2593676 RepID=UPI0033A2A92B
MDVLRAQPQEDPGALRRAKAGAPVHLVNVVCARSSAGAPGSPRSWRSTDNERDPNDTFDTAALVHLTDYKA